MNHLFCNWMFIPLNLPHLFHLSLYPHSSGNCLFVLCIYEFVSVVMFIHLFCFLDSHISEIIWYLSFSVWFISLSIILSRSIHVVTNGKIRFFFFMANILFLFLLFHSSIHPKGDQSWVFTGTTDAKAEETLILWPLHVKSWLIGKDPDAGRDWGQEGDDRGWGGWMASLTQWTWVWVGDGQGGLAYCDSWGCKELDTTEWLNWTDEWTIRLLSYHD